MKESFNVVRATALVLAVALACLTTLSWNAPVPCVDIASLQGMDDGQEVLTRGFLVDVWANDEGSESLVLADREVAVTLWVYVFPSVKPLPSSYARIGDELRVGGSLAQARSGMSLYSDSGSVLLLARAEQALSVKVLSSHWELFLEDDLGIRGFLAQEVASLGPRLFDSDMAHSVAVRAPDGWDSRLLGRTVTVIGKLRFDAESMSIVLEARSINA